MIYVGKEPLQVGSADVKGQFISINDERFYQISNYDRMQPFFISLASDTDLWMYLSSTGSLTAGRKSPDNALFPYYTDDKIMESGEQTGPKTLIRVAIDDKTYLWEPFSNRYQGLYHTERCISKSTVGNKILFSETNHDLNLRFSYLWCATDRFGWVRRAMIENLSDHAVDVDILDGLQNVLPAGTNRVTQNVYSTLVDAYKRTEVVPDSSLVLFRMEAIMVDKAEPAESLRCNTIFTVGLPQARYLTSARQLDAFRQGLDCQTEEVSKGVRGACFANAHLVLVAQTKRTWYQVADVEKDASAVCELLDLLKEPDIAGQIEEAMQEATDNLFEIVKQNDGVQFTGDEHNDARHFANTLFNAMRGGYYLNNYNIRLDDFIKHVKNFNTAVYQRNISFFETGEQDYTYTELKTQVEAQNDAQLTRLFYEYLPLTFGRRHGDPSRPWNLFNIRVKDEQGNPIVSYQGNWRDIFQNWEALSLSYPGYINSIISKFLNATTADGYNPYRVTSEGIDWEVINPDDPWSNIGYWGDHQIIYLTKLLEWSNKFNPQALHDLLNNRCFAFANVPYRIKSYKEIVANPKDSITFDADLHNSILALILQYGEDARLLRNSQGEVVLTTMADKLLITLLTKLSNFIPNAGIWMNTLRPEWNDANNALVGNGASMVTLYYIQRYVYFLRYLLRNDNVVISKETADFIVNIQKAYNANSILDFTNLAGQAGETYRNSVYHGISEQIQTMSNDDLQDFLKQTEQLVYTSIKNNQRQDGLYNAYNLVTFTSDDIEITPLYEMLEGQVAVLSSGALSANEVCDLLDAMRRSALYREDQRSYMLYPNRSLPAFLDKNVLPLDFSESELAHKLLNAHSRLICSDSRGKLHFNADYHNASYLAADMKKDGRLTAVEQKQMLDLYEQVFNHKAFTGRSGSFYKYEGLGSIYWHMVSKLLLAVGENIRDFINAGVDSELINRISAHYDAIREGIGSHKKPEEYGSFPFDAYSHTPAMAGVQQPGMTGQVKEDIISRFNELGIDYGMADGKPIIKFNSWFLDKKDFIDGQLQFTYCNVLIDYRLEDNHHGEIIVITHKNELKLKGYALTPNLTEHLFARDNYIIQIVVFI